MLNRYGQNWVDLHLAAIDEEKVYDSIGAYDPEAFTAYLQLETARLTLIALNHQDDPEFQRRNRSPDE